MKKIAVFCDCIANGMCSMYVLNNNNIKSISGLKKTKYQS